MKTLKKLNNSFDQRFNITHDLDLLIRLSMISKFKYLNKKLSYWRIHSDSFSKNKISVINKEKKMFLKKLKILLKEKKNKDELISLFAKNIKETEIEEYFFKKEFFKMLKIFNEMKNFTLKNILILILMLIPYGSNLYINLKKSY